MSSDVPREPAGYGTQLAGVDSFPHGELAEYYHSGTAVLIGCFNSFIARSAVSCTEITSRCFVASG